MADLNSKSWRFLQFQKFISGVGVLVQWIKALADIVGASAALLPIQRPAIAPGARQRMAQVLEFLPLTWDTKMEFLTPRFTLASPGCCRYLQGEIQWMEISLSLSLYLLDQSAFACCGMCLKTKGSHEHSIPSSSPETVISIFSTQVSWQGDFLIPDPFIFFFSPSWWELMLTLAIQNHKTQDAAKYKAF